MEKKLPSVFVNSGAKKIISNNRKIFYSSCDIDNNLSLKDDNIVKKKIKDISIRKKINDIFSSSKFVYKAKVLITTKEEGPIKEIIISKTPDSILTLSNKKIKYEDIIEIKML